MRFFITLLFSLAASTAFGQSILGGALVPRKYTTTASLPACNSVLPGGMVWDAEAGKLKVCDGASAWAVLGTPAFIARQWGPFSDANNFQLGTGADVLDQQGVRCLAFALSASGTGQVFYSNGNFAAQGEYVQVSGTDVKVYYAANPVITGPAKTDGTLNVLCWGMQGASAYRQQLNGGTVATSSRNFTGEASKPAYIGRYSDAGYGATNVKVRAFYSTTTLWTDLLGASLYTDGVAGRFTSDANVKMNCAGNDYNGTTLTCQTGGAWTTNGTVPFTDP